jgi:tRNA G10  N-methylase Trm11
MSLAERGETGVAGRSTDGYPPPRLERSDRVMQLAEIVKIRPIHPFPARMAPSIAWRRLAGLKGRLTVLDPMAGSGTTPLVARAMGHNAIGYDTDPLAVLIARAWCSDIDPKSLGSAAEEVLHDARRRARNITAGTGYPEGADAETKAFVRYWFDTTGRRQLRALADTIAAVPKDPVRDCLWCAFSRLIITKSRGASLAMDLSHSRPHKVYDVAPVKPFDKFERCVSAIAKAALFCNGARVLPPARISVGDARRLPVDDATVDCVITSPPYLNAIDYLRGHRFALVWMHHALPELRLLRSTNIGAEVSIPTEGLPSHCLDALNATGDTDALPVRWRRILARYVTDMDKAVAELSRVVKPGGTGVFVMGDSTIRGVYIRNSRAILSLAKHHGFRTLSVCSRRLEAKRRHLPPPTKRKVGKELGRRLRREVILTLSRP